MIVRSDYAAVARLLNSKASVTASPVNYPKCKFTSAHRPIAEKCPSCGSEYLVEKNLKAGPVIACPNKECDYERPAPSPEAAATTTA